MNKVVIVGIVVSAVIIAILVVLSFQIFSFTDENDSSSEPILGNEGEDSRNEPKPPGRNLSIELEEKMGLSAP